MLVLAGQAGTGRDRVGRTGGQGREGLGGAQRGWARHGCRAQGIHHRATVAAF